jgi:hypothetical protein
MRLSPFARLSLVASLISLGNFACKPSEPTPDGGACSTAADCAGDVTSCTEHACVDGACRVQPRAAGARIDTQVTGDCRVAVCNGNGGVTSSVDDTDLPVDGVECTRDVCTVGTPSNPPAAADTACGMNGALKCDGAGQCVACQSADDCSMGTACQVRTCTAGVCGFENVAAGTRVGTQTAGDCQASQCDGNGAVTMVADNADVPVDGAECTQDLCTAGVPSNPAVTSGTSCTENDGSRCNATGACVQCVMASDCPGIDTECQTRTCTAGVCGRTFTMDGTAVSSQTMNDCRRNVCDGQGRVVNRADNADLPNDNNACTTDSCNAGTPAFTNRASGDSCGTDLICDGAGACVGCNTASDCPGTDNACSTRTCVNSVCGRNNVANNVQTATQVPNDCRKTVCDGMGNIVTQNDDTDLPVDDGNECTSQSCTAGSPTFPQRAVNSACTQNGGSFCNNAGACVQCNAAAQCAGSDGECSTRTCVNGTCGLTLTPSGTATTTQDTGDCRERQCAGDGGVISVALNTDLPADDGNSCTGQACVAGAPAFPPVPVDTACSQNGGTRCSATGTCVQCNTAAQCGTDTACQTRSCSAAGACSVNNVAVDTVIAAQVPGDCKEARCNGTGGILQANLDTDVPAEDGNQCTAQSCSAGTPSFPAVSSGQTCNQNGGTLCSGTSCVQCRTSADCAGSDTECSVRTCTAGVCGRANTMAGFVTTAQTAGDCQQNQCDGAGNIVSVNRDLDVPAEDGNQCTQQTCVSGVPTFPAATAGAPCSQNGGTFCSGTSCVQCTTPNDCSGTDDECSSRTCNAGTCGRSFVAMGTPVTSQTAGDCRRNECDGSGGTVPAISNGDVPAEDGNQCTDQTCVNGVPTFAAVAPGTACSQNGGTFCSGTTCGSCVTAADCPGTDNECSVRACNAGSCTRTQVLAPGSVVSAQTAGDCQQNRCDATSSAVVSVNFDTDVPASDGNDCTNEQCNAGVPSRPFVPADTSCGPSGTQFCTATGQCVQCNQPSQCSGTDGECQARSCNSNTCGVSNTAQGTLLASQTPGDCKVNQCNGAGGTETVNADGDLPVDGNQCTNDVCTAGVATNPAQPANTACNQNGGTVCDGASACVQCTTAAQCPVGANECQVASCNSNTCGFNNVAPGTVTTSQTPGDCKQGQCDGNGAIVQANFDTDVPADDGNQCTGEVCTTGSASHPPVAAGTACNQNGGTECNASGACVAPPVIVSVTPANGATGAAVTSNIVVTFSKAMNPATITAQTSNGACTGSVQVSADNFATCLSLSAVAMSGSNTIATVTAVPGLAFGSNYKVRVTTAVQDSTGVAMKNQFSMVDGFTTATDSVPGVVISQLYAGGGLTGATYTHDFVELHNRSAAAASIAGWTLQYASATGTSWATGVTFSSGTTIPAGGYFLVQLATNGAIGAALPATNATSSTNMSNAGGKIALFSAATPSSAASCPSATGLVDFVGYGTANCFEGAAASPALTSTTTITRSQSGCLDANQNGTEFSVQSPAPRNAATTALICTPATVNEFGTAELDYCNLQFPTSITVAPSTATPMIYARVFESGVTPSGGTNPALRAQIGYGPASSNPQWQSGWTWTNATFNVQVGNDDEWQATFTSPATTGTYRYTARFSLDGASWTYCDLNGAGANPGLFFETTQLPLLTVQ